MVEPSPAPVSPHVAVFGFDHHRTPIAIRERLVAAGSAAHDLATALTELPGCSEAVVISTCNRLECFYAGTIESKTIGELLGRRHDLDPHTLASHAFSHRDTDCVRHLFRVTSGLESLVLGEYQIAHQVRTAYEQARRTGTTGSKLNPLFQRAMAAAKDVRNRTAIGKHKLSVASVAVDLARQVHGDLATARLLVVGAGEIAELAVRYLVDAGVKSITVINRSEDRAQALADQATGFKPAVRSWDQLGDALSDHDIVVSSTSAPHVVITTAQVRAAMRKHTNPLVFIDLAVPRDIDPGVAELSDVYLYNVDHLDAVVAANRQLRSEDVDAADAVIDELVAQFITETRQDRAQLMAQVATFFTDVVDAEESRLATKLAISDHSELRYGLERVGNKLQHRLLAWLRTNANDPNSERIVREILGL